MQEKRIGFDACDTERVSKIAAVAWLAECYVGDKESGYFSPQTFWEKIAEIHEILQEIVTKK